MAPAMEARNSELASRGPAESSGIPDWTRDCNSEAEDAVQVKRRRFHSTDRQRAISSEQDISVERRHILSHFGGALNADLAENAAAPATSPALGPDSIASSVEATTTAPGDIAHPSSVSVVVPSSLSSTSVSSSSFPLLSNPPLLPPTTTEAVVSSTGAGFEVTFTASTTTELPQTQTTIHINPQIPTSTTAATSTQTTQTTESLPSSISQSSTTTSISYVSTATKPPTLSTDHKKAASQGSAVATSSAVSRPPPPRPDTPADADETPVQANSHGVSANKEKALIGVGVVCGTVIFAIIAWFFWRYVKKSRARRRGTWGKPLPPRPSPDDFDKPSRHVRVLAHVPFLKKRFANRGWFTIDEPYIDTDEGMKQPRETVYEVPQFDTLFDPNKPKSRASHVGSMMQYNYQAERTGILTGHAANQSISSTEGQYDNTLPYAPPPRATYQSKHISEISSLSSGFGDCDIIIPPASPRAASGLRPPPPVQQRDTVYTETSEDTPPRFRTVNSWVRQQAGRAKRAVQQVPLGPPPEPEFTMMMPDGEEPRRATDHEYGIAR